MGFIRWLLRLLGLDSPTPAISESPDTVADRIDRYADRCAAARDTVGEDEARITAADSRRAPTVIRALQLERDLYRKHGLQDDGRPARPSVGTADGTDYVRSGRILRAGGSRQWRYNNPGYVRCSDRSASYGAIGCDGEWAIFETYDDGVRGFHRALQAEHPNQPIGEAVRDMLPAEQAGEVLAKLQQQGVNLAESVMDLGEGAVNTLGTALLSAPDWLTGQTYEPGGPTSATPTAPGWVGAIFSASAPREFSPEETPSFTDNS